MSHRCHAKGCNKYCSPTKLMCFSCWSKVSYKTQQLVYKYYTPGQCNNISLIKMEWLRAAKQAIKEADQ